MTLTCVLNDILLAMDQQKSVFLVLLDLSAAFNTKDHQLLPDCLAGRVGLDGVPLEWICTYLLDRTQFVYISGERSESHQQTSSVPQGLVLGPIFFTIYTQYLYVVCGHSIKVRLHTDDTQLYRTFGGWDRNSEKNS